MVKPGLDKNGHFPACASGVGCEATRCADARSLTHVPWRNARLHDDAVKVCQLADQFRDEIAVYRSYTPLESARMHALVMAILELTRP